MEGAPNVTTGRSASGVTTPRASSMRLTSTARLPPSEWPVSRSRAPACYVVVLLMIPLHLRLLVELTNWEQSS